MEDKSCKKAGVACIPFRDDHADSGFEKRYIIGLYLQVNKPLA